MTEERVIGKCTLPTGHGGEHVCEDPLDRGDPPDPLVCCCEDVLSTDPTFHRKVELG